MLRGPNIHLRVSRYFPKNRIFYGGERRKRGFFGEVNPTHTPLHPFDKRSEFFKEAAAADKIVQNRMQRKKCEENEVLSTKSSQLSHLLTAAKRGN